MFESTPLYLIQTLLISGTVYVLIRRQPRVLRLQLFGWALGVAAIAVRFGPIGQLGTYSNDQIQYAAIVRILMRWDWEGEAATLFWWTEYSKIPYPAAALPIAILGVHVVLALKTVSLIFLLALTREILDRYSNSSFRSQAKVLYVSGCGLIGSFFSLFALRETMMMFFVYRYVISRSLLGKFFAISIVFLLRSHLAAALVAAEVTLEIWKWLTRNRRLGFVEFPILLLLGVTLGYMMFSWRFNGIQGYGLATRLRTPFNSDFGITETIQTASNFAGLQFLTTHEAFIKLSIHELLLLRVVFSDTILIPLGFTVVLIVLGNRLIDRHKLTLLTFAIYVSIVTNTDFNSFRQNIPLMPLMGMVILDFLAERERTSGTPVHNHPDILESSSCDEGGIVSPTIR